MKNKKFQYSKILPLITYVLLCACILKCFNIDISNAYDLSLHIAIITGVITLCLTTNVWYMKNSQAEKVARIKAETYRIISEERFKYNAGMLKLKRKYNFTEEEIFEIENNSPLDELENDALNSLNMSVDNAMEEAVASIEVQNL